MEDEKTLFAMMEMLSHFFDEYISRVQSLVEEQDIEEFKGDQSGTIIRIMKNAIADLEKNVDTITSDMKESKSIDITDLMKAIEDAVNKGGNDGEGGLH